MKDFFRFKKIKKPGRPGYLKEDGFGLWGEKKGGYLSCTKKAREGPQDMSRQKRTKKSYREKRTHEQEEDSKNEAVTYVLEQA